MESFRLVAGCTEPECGPCRIDDCPYEQTFSQSLSSDPAALKRYQKPSLPFVFDVPVLPPAPHRGKTVELGLTIAGSAINYVNEYIAAMGVMLHGPGLLDRVSASIFKVESAGYNGARSLITGAGGGVENGNVLTLSVQGLQGAMVLPSDTVTLTIMTPMRIMGEGKLLREFSFSPFVRALFRRLSSLVYYYGGEEDGADYKWLAGQSLGIETVAADFRWAEWGSKWSGVIGTGTFSGDLSDYHLFLLAGEYLHLGKGASFGLGRFFVDKAASPL